MLPKQENDLLCRVGPGTPMGNLLREYWFPGIPSFELPSADCPPKKVRLLGEDLVAFRDTSGNIGLVAQSCPHRGASLFFGRNEEEGLRCVYHGWKFDVEGNCVDMPSEPAESNFKSKVRARAYPAREVNRVIWVYMGPRETPPPLPRFEITTLPIEQVSEPRLMMEESNWFQNLEGDIDSSHIDYLHIRLGFDSIVSHNVGGQFRRDRTPRMEVVPTDYGAFYSAKRKWDEEGNEWHRISQLIFPFHTMIAAGSADRVSLRSWVPVDDHYTLQIVQSGNLAGPIAPEEHHAAANQFEKAGGILPATSDPRSRYFTVANKRNDFLRDFELERTALFCGIQPPATAGNLQDRAMTELMCNEDGIEPIYDRSREHLGTTDGMVIFTRRALIRAAKALRDEEKLPANVDDVDLDRVRSASAILPQGADWIAETAAARNSDANVPISYVVAVGP